MSIGFKFKVNELALKAKIEKNWSNTLPILSQQILKDCNYYCRQDQGTLIASSLIASNFDNGTLVWDTPYARRVYYTGNPSKDVNCNANLMWCEKAKSEKNKTWEKLANRVFNGGSD